MVKLLSTIILILAIIFFPPAVLAVISNNAVPGDAVYPIKRALEDGIYAVASLNPTTKAWFSAARSDRRFQELSTLLAQGKSASNTLNELVIQTDIAAEQIKKVEDPVKKQELISQLSESIDKYSQKLDEVSVPQIAVITPTDTPIPQVTQAPSPTKAATPTTKPVSTPKPTELPRSSPAQTISPISSQPPPAAPIDPSEADDARKRFEDIKKRLEEQKKSRQEKFQNNEEKKDTKREDPGLTSTENKDKIEKKGNEGDSHPFGTEVSEPTSRAGDDESSRRQRNSSNEK